MGKKLRTYIAYSRIAGQEEGAALIFAYNLREAKKLAWNKTFVSDVCGEYIEMACKRIQGDMEPLANQEKLKAGIAHAVDSPESCIACGMWGCGFDDKGNCGYCGEFPGDRLLQRYKITKSGKET